MLPLAANMEGSRTQRRRDPLLDVWRGLALVDMAWVHLALYPIGMPDAVAQWIGQHTRFAAGTFVLVSGIAVARAFGSSLLERSPAGVEARWRLMRRAALLFLLDRIVGVLFVLLESFRLSAPELTARLPLIWDLLLFRLPGVTGGLLFLYSLLLLATPAMEFVRQRWGGLVLVGLSAAVYTLGYSLSSGSSNAQWPFPFACWQPLFVLGYLGPPWFARISAGQAPWRWFAAIGAAFAVVFLLRNGWAIGFPAEITARSWFVKVPLSPAELAWYVLASLVVITLSSASWHHFHSTRPLWGLFERLGRKSLVVYVAHLLLEVPLLETLTLLDPAPLVRTAALLWMAGALFVVAVGAEALDRLLEHHPWLLPREVTFTVRIPRGLAVGAAVAAGAVSLVVATQRLLGPGIAASPREFVADEYEHPGGSGDAIIVVDEPLEGETTIEDAALEDQPSPEPPLPAPFTESSLDQPLPLPPELLPMEEVGAELRVRPGAVPTRHHSGYDPPWQLVVEIVVTTAVT